MAPAEVEDKVGETKWKVSRSLSLAGLARDEPELFVRVALAGVMFVPE